MYFDDLSSCAELTAEHADEAASSSSSMRAFLRWASDVARPGHGAPKVLMGIARLATAEWIDGTPYIELRGDEAKTTLSIFSDHGIGIRERIVPLARFRVPLDEFTRALRLTPELVHPLRATERSDSLVLAPPGSTLDDLSGSRASMSPIPIDQRSLHEPGRNLAAELPRRGPPITTAPPSLTDQSGVHTRPTVRQMTAIRPEAFRTGNDE